MNYTLYSQRLDAYKSTMAGSMTDFPPRFEPSSYTSSAICRSKNRFGSASTNGSNGKKDGRPKFILFRNRAIRSAKSSNTVWNNSTILNFSI